MMDTKTGWFTESGTDDDVILSTRVRFGRNLADTHFIGAMSDTESENLLNLCTEAFAHALPEDEYRSGIIGDFSPLERRLLSEKRLVPSQYVLNKEYPLFIDRHLGTSGYIKDTDHIRFASICGGRDIEKAFGKCTKLDKAFEKKIEYAASLDWGYVSPDLTSSGLGIRGSFLMHLPGLVKTEMIDNALKAVIQHGFTVKGFHSDTGKSMADLYQISNGIAFGLNEEDFRQKLETLGSQLVHYERKGREELCRKQGLELEDTVMRSYGVLKYCRTLDYMEAIEHLSNLRLGVCLNMLDIGLGSVTALFFLVEKSHLQAIGNTQSEAENNAFRAALIQKYLESTAEEEHHV